MEDKLEEVLSKIIRLARQDEEFGARLRKALGVASAAPAAGNQHDERIGRIEKYLGLDFAVDSKSSTIDYSFVNIDEARDQLVSDNREMMRFRYGTRYHEVCFPEFCRYAQLQLEMLLNYYYDQKNGGDLKRIKAHIIKEIEKTYNGEPNRQRNIDSAKQTVNKAVSLVAIQYATKLWAFTSEFKMGYYPILGYIRDMRNSLSHRSVDDEEFDTYDYRQYLTGELGLPLGEDGEVDWGKIKNDAGKLSAYDAEKKNSDYRLYCYILWRDREPFDDVAVAVDAVAKHVRDRLAARG